MQNTWWRASKNSKKKLLILVLVLILRTLTHNEFFLPPFPLRLNCYYPHFPSLHPMLPLVPSSSARKKMTRIGFLSFFFVENFTHYLHLSQPFPTLTPQVMEASGITMLKGWSRPSRNTKKARKPRKSYNKKRQQRAAATRTL